MGTFVCLARQFREKQVIPLIKISVQNDFHRRVPEHSESEADTRYQTGERIPGILGIHKSWTHTHTWTHTPDSNTTATRQHDFK